MAILVDSGGGRAVVPPPRVVRPIVYPTPPKTTSTRTYTPSKPKTSSKSSGSRTSSSGRTSTAKAADPYAKARADQLADQKKAEKKAADRLNAQAARLLSQADALKIALKELPKALKKDLANAKLEFDEEDALILAQYGRGKDSLERQAGTTEDQRNLSLREASSNAARERNEALQQGIENGIGASDMIKAQAASLRNWSFNAGQVQTNYTDEMNGLKSEHAQMVNSVVTGRQAAWREMEQQRAQLFGGYYDSRGQVLTEVGNKQGEASQYFDMANEQVASKTTQGKAKSAEKAALANLRLAAKQTGRRYSERAAPTSITKWEGTAKIENTTDPRQWGQQTVEVKDAEGAQLRRWET